MSRRSHIKRAKLLRGRSHGMFPSSAAGWRQGKGSDMPLIRPSKGHRYGKRFARAWMLACRIRSGYPRRHAA